MKTNIHQTNATPPSLRDSIPSFSASPVETFTSRYLRHYETANVVNKDDTEERVGLSDLSTSVGNLVNKAFLKLDMNPSGLFAMLNLAHARVKLDNNARFIQWFQYVLRYRQKELRWFDDDKIFKLLQKSKSEDDLVTLFHNLRQVPELKNLADKMQRMLWKSPSSHELMSQIWLKTSETPNEVFKILNLKSATLDVHNKKFLQWLRYTELYRAEKGVNSFSELQTMHFLLDAKPIETQFGTVFQKLKQFPDLEKLAENMQIYLFERSIHVLKYNPKHFGDLLVNPSPWKSILTEPKNDATFQTLEAYTLKYAKALGGDDAEGIVKTLFAKDEPIAAIEAAMKVAKLLR
ncbi:RxLR effector protein [Phytophthora megakarya]|uniref:RxLR effector protein n=1 Tax=Phytophthora megakarya TaxID=4795 RepID=A0A225UUW5_9STRA|nr:RxLR effector protein [Phytophthora megakarya]